MDKLKHWSEGPQGQKAGAMFKKVETKTWRVLEPVGKFSNKIAGRMGAESFWPQELAAGEIEKAARILRTFTIQGAQADDDPRADVSGGVVADGVTASQQHSPQQNKDKYASRKTQKVIKKIPPSALQGAVGVAIFTCFRTGLGLSGASGSGVVLAKLPDGSWGPPSGILIHTLGYGFLIGIDIYDVVLIIRKEAALKTFEKPKISIGGEFSVAAGPVGNGATVNSGIESAPCWSYTKSKGAYAGIQLDGTVIVKRDDANARFYAHSVTVADILKGRYKAPSAALPLLQTLYAAEGRPDVLGTDHIPDGLAPGDTELTEEEKKELEANGHAQEHSQAHAHAPSSSPSSSTHRPNGHRVPPPPPPRQSHAQTPLPTQEPPSLPDQAPPQLSHQDPPAYDAVAAAAPPPPTEKDPFAG